MQTPSLDKLKEYAKHFTDEDFWKKVKDNAITVGKEGLRQVLILFYVLQKADVPAWAKGVILGSLGYFILPVDLIPDIIPGAGYTEDLTLIAAAVGMVAMYVDDEVKEKADQKLNDWFGNNSEQDKKDGNDIS